MNNVAFVFTVALIGLHSKASYGYQKACKTDRQTSIVQYHVHTSFVIYEMRLRQMEADEVMKYSLAGEFMILQIDCESTVKYGPNGQKTKLDSVAAYQETVTALIDPKYIPTCNISGLGKPIKNSGNCIKGNLTVLELFEGKVYEKPKNKQCPRLENITITNDLREELLPLAAEISVGRSEESAPKSGFYILMVIMAVFVLANVATIVTVFRMIWILKNPYTISATRYNV